MKKELGELKYTVLTKLTKPDVFPECKCKLFTAVHQPHYKEFLIKTIEDVADWKQFFTYMDECWYILDVRLLEVIIDLISPEANNQMEKYNEMLKEIEMQPIALVAEALQELDIHPDTSKDTCFSSIIEKLNWDPKRCTVRELNEFCKSKQQELRKLGLTKCLMILYHVAVNCVVVTWLVPSYDVELLCEIFEQLVEGGTYFQQNNIISIQLNNHTYMTMEMALFQATESNNIKRVDELLEKWNRNHHDINKTNEKDETSLIVASKLGYSGIVALLLEVESIDINYLMPKTSKTALFLAREGKHQRTVNILKQYGAKEVQDKGKKTGNEAFPEEFHEHSHDVEEKSSRLRGWISPLVQTLYSVFKPKGDMFKWCLKGDYDQVSMALKSRGSDSLKETDSEKNWTPLMWACYGGHYDVVELLVRHDQDGVHFKSVKRQWTPLLIAVGRNYLRIANFLLKHKANPNDIIDPVEFNYSGLMYISDLKYIEMARTLLKHGAMVDITNKRDRATPLFQAIATEDEEMLLLFLDYKADVNVQADKGWSPLMEAVRTNNKRICNLLLSNGARVTLEMKDAGRVTGETALHVACFYGADDIVKILLMCESVDANKENKAGLTPLMIAIQQQNEDVVRTLAQCALVDVNHRHKELGISPLTIAALTGNMKICVILLESHATAEETWFVDLLPSSWKKMSGDFLEKFETAVPQPVVKLMNRLWKEYFAEKKKRI